MSGLRSSNSVINTVVDTLRFRGVTEPGLLITSSSGAVSVGTAPTLTNLAVTGTSMLGSAVVMGPLTANSVNALASLTTPTAFITTLDVSNATIANIANLSFSSASVSSLDASNGSIGRLDASSASINMLTATNGSIGRLDASNAVITILDVSSAAFKRLDASSAYITVLDASNGSIDRLAVDISASIANLTVNPSLSVVNDAQSLTVTPTSLYSSVTPFKIGTERIRDILRVVDDGYTGYVSVGDGSGARVYIAGAGAEGQIQMNTGSGGILNIGSSTSTNASAIVLSDTQFKINAPYSNKYLINPAITVTDIYVNIFTPGTSNPAISVDASRTTITILDVSSATFKRLDASSALINTLNSTNATVSAGLYAKAALIGDNTNTSDPSQNFVFIQAPAGQTFGRVRGPNLANGTLQLGANSSNLSNITLNADGTTTISNKLTTGNFIAADALIGDSYPGGTNVYISTNSIRGPGRGNGTLVLGANNIATNNITLNADSSTTIPTLNVDSSLQLFTGGSRSYVTDPGVAYPTIPWFFFQPNTAAGTEISRIGVTNVNNIPITYPFNINTYCKKYSLIQVNISFDAYLAQNGYTSATFSIRSDTMSAGVRRPKSLFVTSVYLESGLRITNPYTISFFMTKNYDYDNTTSYFSFHYENMLNPLVDLYFGNATGSFFWEVIGLV